MLLSITVMTTMPIDLLYEADKMFGYLNTNYHYYYIWQVNCLGVTISYYYLLMWKGDVRDMGSHGFPWSHTW